MMTACKVLLSATVGLGLSAVLVPLTGATLSGCCLGRNGAGYAGLVVTVTDGPGGARICDATVTARDGSYSTVLQAFASQPDCKYEGAYERPGTYDIEVVSGTRSRTVDNVRVTTEGACEALQTQHLTVVLDP